jgi:hypothetical protein
MAKKWESIPSKLFLPKLDIPEWQRVGDQAVDALASSFAALPGLIDEQSGNVRRAIADMLGLMAGGAGAQQTTTQLAGAGYGGIAAMLTGMGDSPQNRAAAAYLGEMLATEQGRAYLSHLEADIEYANHAAAWAANDAIQADAARWAGAGAAAAAAFAAGYSDGLSDLPAPGFISGKGGVGSGGGKGVSVNIGMVVGDDAAVDKAVTTALKRAKQRGG